jgi:hypothetical protein
MSEHACRKAGGLEGKADFASSAAAEKSIKGAALKTRTGARPIADDHLPLSSNYLGHFSQPSRAHLDNISLKSIE